MIYGLNFGGPDVSKAPVKFAATLPARIGQYRARLRLVGVTDSAAEKDAMLVTADNGRRPRRVEERSVGAVTLHAQ